MRKARVDTTAASLTALARQMGADILPINGVIDCLVYFRGDLYAVDWKSKGGTLTPDQSRLVARGWPIKFVSTEQQLKDLLLR